MKISIITPCYNSYQLLKETVLSVLNQKAFLCGQVDVEYVICDGGSQDGTQEWINELKHPSIRFFSEKDGGIYDALAKGCSRASGDVTGYLNCGDYYGLYTFNILKDVFSDPEIKWITGYNAWYNENGYLVSANLPFRYRRNFILKGLYATCMPWIQQESTFWRAEMLSVVDLDRLSCFKLAGDYYLWHQFAKSAELKIVKAYLGGFREHAGQLSEDKALYRAEIANIVRKKPNVFDYSLALMDYVCWWCLPDRLKLGMNKSIIKI